MKITILFVILQIATSSFAQDVRIGSNGELLLDNNKEWLFKDFTKHGLEISIDYEVYISEGVLSDSKDNYNVYITKNNNIIAVIEIIDKAIWRGSIISSEVPIATKNKDTNLGISLYDAINYFGNFKSLGQGDDIGAYLEFENLVNSILHTHCVFYGAEQTEEEKKMSKEELYKHCKIDKMVFFGSKRPLKDNEF